MIAFKDFAPKQISAPGLLSAGEYETFDAAVSAANAWIARRRAEVLSVETVVLPNVWSPHSEGTADPNQVLQHGPHAWNQFVRVWYRLPDEPAEALPAES